MSEQTLVIIKPDGVKRHLVGRLVQRFENTNLSIQRMEMKRLSPELIEEHYQHLIGRSFFPELCNYMMEAPVVVMVLSGNNAIARVRHLVGATNPLEAQPGTIRSDLALSQTRNTVHASDSVEAAQVEIARFFAD